MITTLSLENFKAFEDEKFEFGSLNVLSGLNNSGKSSIIQSLRLLYEQKALSDLGPLDVYIRNDTKGFSLMCEQKTITKQGIVLFSHFKIANEIMKKLYGPVNFEPCNMDGIVSYISADRLGPRNSLPLSIDEDITTVGSRGEYIVDFLTRLNKDWDDLQVPDSLTATEGNGVESNIKEWLRFISPGVVFDYSSDKDIDIGRTMFNKHRPVHVGFGLSYTLPIIASILIHASQLKAGKTESVLMLLENPEAHLHPSGQTKMGEMLAKAASCGVQIVVETHSDHILNGIRIAVKEKIIPHTDVKCFYFKSGSWDGTNEDPSTVDRIEIDKYGMVDFWPEGFFDETERSLQRLI
jgi:predicted ATPase